jgi:hypothetical protein
VLPHVVLDRVVADHSIRLTVVSVRHYLAYQAGRTNMWRAALSPIASTLVTQRVAEVERNRFLAVGAVRMNRERHGLEVSRMTVKRVLKSLEAERTAA